MKRLHYLYYIPLIYGFVGAAFAAVAHSWTTARPNPNFQNLPTYITALERSQDPQMMAFKRQIAAGPANLAREERLAEADGIPVTLAQVQPPMPPLSENAAPNYQQWRRLLKQNHAQLPPYADALNSATSYTPTQLALAQAFFTDNKAAIRDMHQAAEKPFLVFSGDPIRHEATLMEADRELCSESYLLAKRGQYQQAIAIQSLGFRIAQQVSTQPRLISYLVAIAIDDTTRNGMKNLLYLAGSNAKVDTAIQRAVESRAPVIRARFAFSCEVPRTLAYMDKAKADPCRFYGAFAVGGGEKLVLTPAQRDIAIDLIDAAEAHYLSVMRYVIPLIDAPVATKEPVFNQFSYPADANDVAAPTLSPIAYIDDRFLLPNYNQLTPRMLNTEAQQVITLAAASILAFKGKTGAFPTELPGKFIDPFNGKPLGYRREGKKGFVVYSVGLKENFKGGIPNQHYIPQQAFFRYPGPKPTPVPKDWLSYKTLR